ncbi:MAG: glycosyltransferase family 4 protein [Beijerinckiaceae bacterium]
MPPIAEQPIRIRFEHTLYPHWGGHSGYAQFVRHLDRERYRTVLHGAPDSNDGLPLWLKPLRPGIKYFIRRGQMPWYKMSDLHAELIAFAHCLAGQVDIVHFLDGEHSGQFLPRLLRLARLKHVRTVATFHQPPDVATKLLNPKFLRRFDQVVLMSPSQLPYFKQHVAEDRLHIILHGIDTEFFHSAPTRNRSNTIRCITVGHWLRDWEVFRAVASAMRTVAFDVVTNRPIAIDGLPNVRTHSAIDDAALASLYRAVDVLFLPLVQSTANNALLEGIASGLPVVATDLEAVRAYLPGGEGILVDGNRLPGFVEALTRLAGDVDARLKMGRCARSRAEALAWPHQVREYETLYREALARPPNCW